MRIYFPAIKSYLGLNPFMQLTLLPESYILLYAPRCVAWKKWEKIPCADDPKYFYLVCYDEGGSVFYLDDLESHRFAEWRTHAEKELQKVKYWEDEDGCLHFRHGDGPVAETCAVRATEEKLGGSELVILRSFRRGETVDIHRLFSRVEYVESQLSFVLK